MDGEGSDQRQDERGLFSPAFATLQALPAARDQTGLSNQPLPALSPPMPRRMIAAGRVEAGPVHASEQAASAVQLEIDRGGAFLLVPVLLCAGAAVYFALDFEPGWTPILSLAGLFGAVAWLARNVAVARYLALALLLLVGGAFFGKVETWRSSTKVIGGEITTRLTGRVETIETREKGRIRLTLAVMATERPKLRYQPDRVRLTARSAPPGLEPGAAVTGLARLAPPLGPLRPGSYDFAFESYFDRIGASGFFLKRPEVLPAADESSLRARVEAWIEARRLALAGRIRGHIGGPEGEIAAALVAGVRAGIPEDVNETLRITGLAHVLSISGLHMALVAGVVIGSLRLGFAAFPGFASRHPVRKYAAVGALAALAAYLLISGSQVAAERSFLMIAVMLVALLFDRAALTMRNLAIAALIIIVLSPHEVVGPSFQMSFAATAALVSAYGWWAERRARRAQPNPAQRGALLRIARTVVFYAAGLAATSLIAGVATGIFGAWHFQRVSPLGLVANLAAMPVFSVVVMPAAVAGMVLMPFGLDGPVFIIMGQGLSLALAIVRWLAERTPVDAIGAVPSASVVLLALALVPLTLATTTAVRLLAVPLAVVGFASLTLRELPQAYVSEDARLVGIRTRDGMLAVNRDRPNAFTVEDWSRATMATGIMKPAKETEAGTTGTVMDISPARFFCAGDLCRVEHESGAVVAHALTMPDAEQACDTASVIVIADPTAANPCPHSKVQIITARRLALDGSAEIRFDGVGNASVTYALSGTRPWHDHRRFSRAARGMAPYEPANKKAGTKPAS
ncbi:ComEC/Rec2 family competence protein [Mesorhizobium sp. J428]|uniref:ComEC/Rec2 family competence protein n=1 Tax=Mesorhizobium sp. J428 TaxID=2898440 RepID=UPI002151F7DD|nr:ComEC/Rec2 family competence protein [Mesorhizobium sp. J428]MCR5859828.1 ComEC family competence protein [Mesorhizobium sp. J428]